MFSVEARTTAAMAIASRALTASLHSADPGSNGTSGEISGGGYERQPVSWNSTPGMAYTSPVEFAGPAGTEIRWVGLWDGSTWIGSAGLQTPTDIGEAGIAIDIVQIVTLNA